MESVFPAIYVFGSSTNVGKTLIASGLACEAVRATLPTRYTKPVQTGYATGDLAGSDAHTVRSVVENLVLQGVLPKNSPSLLTTETLFSFPEPISPHRTGAQTTDSAVLAGLNERSACPKTRFWLVEGAGGVASPSLEGRLQCDVYRSVRLPVVLVGDHRLGGISATISAYELLYARGYEIVAVALFAGTQKNHLFLREHYRHQCPVVAFKRPGKAFAAPAFYQHNQKAFAKLFLQIQNNFHTKIQTCAQQRQRSQEHLWWPFTQHKITSAPHVIDSAFGDYFTCLVPQAGGGLGRRLVYDGSASWWTQNLGHGWNAVVREASHAAGRFGHVMFPGNICEPVLNLATALLETVGASWHASRVFFSDNGSTAIEIALKMAFRKAFGTKKTNQPVIVGLKDSFHGETHAAMDATQPNAFKLHDHWYNPRGVWIDYPSVFQKNGVYVVRLPRSFAVLPGSQDTHEALWEMPWSCQEEIFALNREHTALAEVYQKYINEVSKDWSQHTIGACILEGVVQGACGFHWVDPLFQRLFVQHCQKQGIPVILDEVFTGLWRIGRCSVAAALHIQPDIVCYGKHLTGGLLPLGVVLATETVFAGFLGDDLKTALLHGHSYTANPISCAAACRTLQQLQTNPRLVHGGAVDDFWCKELVKKLSSLPSVERAYALGTVFALELVDVGGDYASQTARALVSTLRVQGIELRPLGNVIYLLAGFETPQHVLDRLLVVLHETLMIEQTKDLR